MIWSMTTYGDFGFLLLRLYISYLKQGDDMPFERVVKQT